MKPSRILFSIGLILAAILPAKAQTPVKTVLEEAREAHGLPAMGAILIDNGEIGEPQVTGVVGTAIPTVVRPDARWHLGSCGKSMTAMLAAAMVERGDLTWDLTLGQAFDGSNIEVHPGFRDVTIDQLLRHRGGLAGNLMKQPIWGQLRMTGGPAVKQRGLITKVSLNTPPATAPDAEFVYANEGYVIVGHILERIAGKPYEDLMREHVFGPMGLTTAGFGPPPGERDPRGHKWNTALPPHRLSDNPEGLSPAGRIHMSLKDWATYALAHLRAVRGDGFELISEASYQKLHTVRDGEYYALGWGRPAPDWSGGPTLAHAGSNTMWRAEVWIAPQRNAAILVTTNNGTDKATAAIEDVIERIAHERWSSARIVETIGLGHVPFNTVEQGFILQVADTTGLASEASPIYVASNHNGWDPADPDWRMKLVNGHWTLTRPPTHATQPMLFKFTRGSWETVEVAKDLADIKNRRASYIDPGDVAPTVELQIVGFADQRP